MVERVRALSELREGKRSGAVAVLRDACDRARSLPAVERSRCHLAYALGLARAARPFEALIEAIEALARAREASETNAESACLAFLRLLYEGQARSDAADWQSAAAR